MRVPREAVSRLSRSSPHSCVLYASSLSFFRCMKLHSLASWKASTLKSVLAFDRPLSSLHCHPIWINPCSMDKPSSVTHHEEAMDASDLKHSITQAEGALADNTTEHQLTLRVVWKNHPALIGWCFYWSMCAIGWLESQHSATRSRLTCPIRGSDGSMPRSMGQ